MTPWIVEFTPEAKQEFHGLPTDRVVMTTLYWLWALADAAYCEAYWDYCQRWDRLMMVFREDPR